MRQGADALEEDAPRLPCPRLGCVLLAVAAALRVAPSDPALQRLLPAQFHLDVECCHVLGASIVFLGPLLRRAATPPLGAAWGRGGGLRRRRALLCRAGWRLEASAGTSAHAAGAGLRGRAGGPRRLVPLEDDHATAGATGAAVVAAAGVSEASQQRGRPARPQRWRGRRREWGHGRGIQLRAAGVGKAVLAHRCRRLGGELDPGTVIADDIGVVQELEHLGLPHNMLLDTPTSSTACTVADNLHCVLLAISEVLAAPDLTEAAAAQEADALELLLEAREVHNRYTVRGVWQVLAARQA
mmetsp:Transcript_103792/g.302956  ORF Transcript_103792/g.302956 Transcript_103792/m.302956 type:complete len:299 (+) Transcript_103792:301-1197(+)